MNRMTVLYPITVPCGKYCWEYTPPHTICGFFDTEGGHKTCALRFYPLMDTDEGVLKAEQCASLSQQV